MLRARAEKAAFYDFSLEAGRPGLGDNERAVVQVMRSRFAGMKLAFVVAIGAPAARFYAQHREELFPSPAVGCGGAPHRGAQPKNSMLQAVYPEWMALNTSNCGRPSQDQ
jgi:hypothetical protein